MEFEYFATKVVNASLEVDNIGDCAIKASNDVGEDFYLLIETRMGESRVFTYGPACVDFDLMPKSVNCSFKRLNFDVGKLRKIINDFLNSPYHSVTSAITIEKDQLLAECKSIVDYMKQEVYW